MVISRRSLLTGGVVAASASRFALGQERPQAIIIDVPGLELYPGTETFVAVNTSGFTSCEVAVLDPNGVVKAKSPNWSTEPSASQGQAIGRLTTAGDPRNPVKHTVKITMQPTKGVTPSVAVALTQPEPTPSRLVVGRGGGGADRNQGFVDQVRQIAKRARFVEDPASPPGGHFVAALSTDASVLLRIWKGERASGAPIHERAFGHLSIGDQEIPWDLKAGRALVTTGRYTGVLVCTPETHDLKPTNLVAYFGVRTP